MTFKNNNHKLRFNKNKLNNYNFNKNKLNKNKINFKKNKLKLKFLKKRQMIFLNKWKKNSNN